LPRSSPIELKHFTILVEMNTPYVQKIRIFWDITSGLLVNTNPRLEVSYCVNLQGQTVPQRQSHYDPPKR